MTIDLPCSVLSSLDRALRRAHRLLSDFPKALRQVSFAAGLNTRTM
jgi:hypothetical protein